MEQVQNQDTKPEEKKAQPEAQAQPAKQEVKAASQPDDKPLSDENKVNWKAFREQREAERKAREDADKRAREKEAEANALKAAMEAILNKPTSNNGNVPPQYMEQQEEPEDQRIKRLVREEVDRERKLLDEERRKEEQRTFPQKLQNDFKDFHNICSSENIDYLDYHYPEVSAPLATMPEGYEKWSLIYKAVKRFVPNTDGKKEIAKAERNLQKPQAFSAPGTTQGSGGMQTAKLTQAQMDANWARMQRVMKGLS